MAKTIGVFVGPGLSKGQRALVAPPFREVPDQPVAGAIVVPSAVGGLIPAKQECGVVHEYLLTRSAPPTFFVVPWLPSCMYLAYPEGEALARSQTAAPAWPDRPGVSHPPAELPVRLPGPHSGSVERTMADDETQRETQQHQQELAVLRHWRAFRAACEGEALDSVTFLAALGVNLANLLADHPELAEAWVARLSRQVQEELDRQGREPN